MQAVTITQITSEELELIINNAVASALQNLPQSRSNNPYTITEAAEYCTLAESTIRKAVRSKKLEFSRKCGKLFFFESDLIGWIKSK